MVLQSTQCHFCGLRIEWSWPRRRRTTCLQRSIAPDTHVASAIGHTSRSQTATHSVEEEKNKARLLLIAESSVFVFCFSNEKTAVYKQLSQNKKERRCTNWKRSFCDQILDNTSQHQQRTQQDSSARSPMPTVSTSSSRESLRNRGESCNEKTKNRQSNHSTPPHNDRDKSHTSPINENHAFRKFSKIYLYTKKWTENK